MHESGTYVKFTQAGADLSHERRRQLRLSGKNMTKRVQWTETVTCPGCGKMGNVKFSGGGGGDGCDRVERGMSGFITETTEYGFQFRCVECTRIARLTRPD
jgi:hypothetical protein